MYHAKYVWLCFFVFCLFTAHHSCLPRSQESYIPNQGLVGRNLSPILLLVYNMKNDFLLFAAQRVCRWRHCNCVINAAIHRITINILYVRIYGQKLLSLNALQPITKNCVYICVVSGHKIVSCYSILVLPSDSVLSSTRSQLVIAAITVQTMRNTVRTIPRNPTTYTQRELGFSMYTYIQQHALNSPIQTM